MVENAEKAEMIAKALINAEYKGPVLSYVEFKSPEDMLIFFKLLKILETIGDPNKFEENVMELKKEYENLKALIEKQNEKEVIIEINGSVYYTRLGSLYGSGVYAYGNYIKIETAQNEKIKIIFKTNTS